MDCTLQLNGYLLDLSTPCVMGILNVTPDSFYEGSRKQTERDIAERAVQIVAEGGRIIDVGGCSTRPGGEQPSEAEEMERLRRGLQIVRREVPDALLSVDTYRPQVARMVVEEFGDAIVNDVSGGSEEMFRLTARLGVPYVLTSVQADMGSMLTTLAAKVQQLRDWGQKDIIVDPGFGFGKSLADNYRVLAQLDRLQALRLPVLVGVSRKSMIYRLLDTTPAEALNGTTALHALALERGAAILRVHDVRQAVECVVLCEAMK